MKRKPYSAPLPRTQRAEPYNGANRKERRKAEAVERAAYRKPDAVAFRARCARREAAAGLAEQKEAKQRGDRVENPMAPVSGEEAGV